MILSRWVQLASAALLLLSASVARAQTSGGISGVVRDGSGVALSGVALTLSGEDSPAVALHTATDKLGAFRFDRLALGKYRISADRSGAAISPNDPITLSASSPAVQLSLTLGSLSGAAPKPPSLQLQAAGIRGYIDPGGYSAPAGAAAASSLIHGAADLNRVDTATAQAAALACAREPVLLQAVADHPDNAASQRQAGEFYLARHQPEKALAYLQRAWMLDAHDTSTRLSLAEALLQNKQFAAAHDLLTLTGPAGNTAPVHRLLARSEEGLGAFQQAYVEYLAAAALDPTESDFYGAGYELILDGSAKSAIKIFESGTARFPGSTTLLMGIGTADFLLGQSSEATRIFLRCAALHPDDGRLYPFLSASFAISGTDPETVEASFRRYHELNPGSADAAYFYALIRLRKGTDASSAEAEALLRQAIQAKPEFARAHLQLGSLLFNRGDFASAADEFATTLRLDPTLWETHYKLSMAYKRAGKADLADQQMQLFLASKRQNSTQNAMSDAHLESFLSVFSQPALKPNPTGPCVAQK